MMYLNNDVEGWKNVLYIVKQSSSWYKVLHKLTNSTIAVSSSETGIGERVLSLMRRYKSPSRFLEAYDELVEFQKGEHKYSAFASDGSQATRELNAAKNGKNSNPEVMDDVLEVYIEVGLEAIAESPLDDDKPIGYEYMNIEDTKKKRSAKREEKTLEFIGDDIFSARNLMTDQLSSDWIF